jgi:hypothetical protein
MVLFYACTHSCTLAELTYLLQMAWVNSLGSLFAEVLNIGIFFLSDMYFLFIYIII